MNAFSHPWLDPTLQQWPRIRLSFRYDQQLGKMLSAPAAEGPDQRPYLANKDVQWDRVVIDDLRTMHFSAEERVKFRLRAGDLLVCEGGDVGRTAVWRDELAECYFQKAVHRLRALDPSTDFPRFMFYCLFAAARSGAFSDAGSATIDHLTGETLRATRFPFPPFIAQRAIADFLDRKTAAIDDLIAKKERLIELLEEKRAALINQAVTKGLDPNVPMKDSGIPWIGEIPAHWELPPLYARYHVQLGKMLDSAKQTGEWAAPYLRNANIHWDHLDTDDLKSMDFTPADRVKFRLRPGDILMCEGGANAQVVGRCAVWTGELEDCYYQKALHRIRAASQKDVPRFLFYVLWAASEMGEFVVDSNANIYHITAEKLRVMRFPFPPMDEQHAIVDRLDRELGRMCKTEDLLRAQNAKLTEYRQALITAAVTGQLDIRAAEGEAA